jgi:hypothetical protein
MLFGLGFEIVTQVLISPIDALALVIVLFPPDLPFKGRAERAGRAQVASPRLATDPNDWR